MRVPTYDLYEINIWWCRVGRYFFILDKKLREYISFFYSFNLNIFIDIMKCTKWFLQVRKVLGKLMQALEKTTVWKKSAIFTHQSSLEAEVLRVSAVIGYVGVRRNCQIYDSRSLQHGTLSRNFKILKFLFAEPDSLLFWRVHFWHCRFG